MACPDCGSNNTGKVKGEEFVDQQEYGCNDCGLMFFESSK